MPVYNTEKYLIAAVNSILSQSYYKFELIIIDDGSTDNSLEILRNINDHRIKVFSIKHQGIASSMNFGVLNAKYDIIARMDSDDFSHQDRLLNQISFLSKFDDSNNYVVSCNFFEIDENDKIIGQKKNPEIHFDIQEQLTRRCPIINGALMLHKRIIIENDGFDESYSLAEDWDFYLRIMNKVKFYNIQKPLYYVREHFGRSTKTGELNEMIHKALFKNLKREEKIGINNIKRAKLYFDIAHFCYYNSLFERAKLYFIISNQNEKSILNYRFLIILKYMKSLLKISRKYKLYRIYGLFKKKQRKYKLSS